MVPLAGMVTKGGIMIQLGVRMSDLYGNAQFNIEVPEISKDAILEGIEANYHKAKQQIDGIMGGYVRVYQNYDSFPCSPCKEVAHGSITYWGLPGGHTIRLEMRKAA